MITKFINAKIVFQNLKGEEKVDDPFIFKMPDCFCANYGFDNDVNTDILKGSNNSTLCPKDILRIFRKSQSKLQTFLTDFALFSSNERITRSTQVFWFLFNINNLCFIV